MAKTLVQLANGLRVKYIVKEKAFMLFNGAANCFINGDYKKFETQQECEDFGNKLPAQKSIYYTVK